MNIVLFCYESRQSIGKGKVLTNVGGYEIEQKYLICNYTFQGHHIMMNLEVTMELQKTIKQHPTTTT